jgi:hypothetical protein
MFASAFDVHVFPIQDKSVSDIRKFNFTTMSDSMKSGNSVDAVLFIMTDENIFYLELDLDTAIKMKCSPLDQVKPILEVLSTRPEFKNINAYQVIAEAWMKSFHDKEREAPIAYGDIALMPSRVEILMESFVEKNNDTEHRVFEIIREVNSDKLIKLKEVLGNTDYESTKFPSLPIKGEMES